MVVPVDSQNGVRQYVWDNVTKEFSYPYIIESDSLFARLYNNNGELVLEIPSTAYSLSDPVRSDGVLEITDNTVLATEADKIILERVETLDQGLDLGKRDFPPQDIEDAFDKSRIIDQQQQSLSNRSVITNIVEDRQEPIELPPAVENLFLAWDNEGNLKNATSTGTALPTVPNTYLRRNNDNTAFSTLTPTEVLSDIGAISSTDPDYALPTITANTYLKANVGATEYEALTTAQVKTDLGVVTGVFEMADEKTIGSDGGASIVGIQTRTLNTVRENTISGASLSSNQFTLPAGRYKIQSSALAFNSQQSYIYLYNVTDASYDFGSKSGFNSATDIVQSTLSFTTYITIASTKVYEIRQQFEVANANGLGIGSLNTLRNPEFVNVLIEKIG